MSTSVNPAAMKPGQGEFHARVPPSKPMTTKGHAPGVKVGKDAVPEFHAETHPPGTAPAESTFEPNPDLDSNYTTAPPVVTQPTSAADTLGGATSADVHKGYGMPIGGDNKQRGKTHRSGLEGVGANAKDPIQERKLDQEHEPGQRMSEGYRGAEEVIPEKPGGINYQPQ